VVIVDTALQNGLSNLIQHGHPRGDKADYLTFSDAPDHYWVFVLDMDSCPTKSHPRWIKFSKRYQDILEGAGINFRPEWRSNQHLIISVSDLEAALRATAPYWNTLGAHGGAASER
jgi:hypothetical protein